MELLLQIWISDIFGTVCIYIHALYILFLFFRYHGDNDHVTNISYHIYLNISLSKFTIISVVRQKIFINKLFLSTKWQTFYLITCYILIKEKEQF